MKILHIVPTYLPAYRYGGPILSVHSLNKWLVKKGIAVTVFTTNIDGQNDLAVPLNEPVLVDGVNVFYFKASFPRGWFYSRGLHSALAKQAKDFDLIHITSVFLAASALGAHYAKRFKKPYVISPRGSLMREPLVRKSPLLKNFYLDAIEKRNLAGAVVHFTAETEKKEYLASGLPLRDSFVIPNGLDLEDFKESFPADSFRKKWNIAEDRKIILFMSRINWKKGLDSLIPAFAEVVKREPKAFLVLDGADDGYKLTAEKMIAKYNIGKDVLFTGSFEGLDAPVMKTSSCFVLPSYSENFGMAVVQAMYFGLPVVVTKGVGISPLIKEAEAGLVVNKSTEEIAMGILKILGDEYLAERFRQAGKKLVQKEFSPAAVADKFIQAYNQIKV